MDEYWLQEAVRQFVYTTESVATTASTTGPEFPIYGAGTVKALVVPMDDTAHAFSGYLQMQERASGVWINVGVVDNETGKSVPLSATALSDRIRVRVDNNDAAPHAYGVTIRAYPGASHNN